MASEQLTEREIFKKYYASLCITLTDINGLLPFFVQERIISFHALEEISAIITTQGKVGKLLLHISGPLTAGDATGFHKMLTIMKEHGSQATKDLAVKMNSEIEASSTEREPEAPPVPMGLKATSTHNSIRLSWQLPPSSSTLNINYILKCKKATEQDYSTIQNIMRTDHEITGLIASTEYQFKVAVVDGDICGSFTENFSQYTGSDLKYTLKELYDQVKKKLEDINQNIVDKDMINNSVELLLMVVNSSEYYAAMYYFSKSEAGTISEDGYQFYVGKWGKVPACLVRQIDSGFFGDGRSEHLTRLSINLFPNLKFIVALGVCGTVGNIGDVIVSTKICGCNDLKITDDSIINRSEVTEAGSRILRILKNNHELWSFVCTKPECTESEHMQNKSKAVFKPMLSGTPLIASGDYRDKLIEGVRKEAVGVEMEGIGVLEALKQAKKRDEIEFVIVKAGCDYADQSKNKEWQPVAAMAASDFLYKQLAKENVYEQFLMDLRSKDDEAKLNPDICEIICQAKDKGLLIKARHSKVLFCGSSGVGKTNFINLLLCKDFVDDHISTGPTESHQILAKQVIIKGKSRFEDFNYNEQIDCLKRCLRDKKFQIANNSEEMVESKKHIIRENDGTTDAKPEQEQDNPASLTSVSGGLSESLNKSELGSPSNIAAITTSSESNNMLAAVKQLASSDDVQSEEAPDVWDMLTFLDTGGQPEYIAMLPAVNTSAMITFILHSMEGGVDRLVNGDVTVIQDGEQREVLLNYKYLNLIKMLFSMRKVKMEQGFDAICSTKGDRKCYLSLVGTKSDVLGSKLSEETESMREELMPIIEAGELEDSLITIDGEYFVSVCNFGAANDVRDPNGAKFRELIYDYLQKRDVHDIPIVWLLLELEILRRTRVENKNIIYFEEIRDICTKYDPKLISSEKEIRVALEYFHHIGVFLYYGSDNSELKNIVITDHKWIFENLKQVAEEAKGNKAVFKPLKLNGFLKEKAIKDIDWKLGDTESKYFFKLLEMLGIASIMNSRMLKGYFIPSVLPNFHATDKENFFKKHFGTKVEEASQLLMQIAYNGCKADDNNCYKFPTGVFCYLINQLLSLNNFKNGIQLSKNKGNRIFFNDLIALYDSDRRCYVILTNKLMHMEVELRQLDDKVKPSFFSEIRCIILSDLKKACEKLKLDISYISIGFQHPNATEGEFYYTRGGAELNGKFPDMFSNSNALLPCDDSKNIWFSAQKQCQTSLKDFEADFQLMLADIKKAFDDSSVNLNDLLKSLEISFATKNHEIPLFPKSLFQDVKTNKELFKVLDCYWNPFDHDMLSFFVTTSNCECARRIYAKFCDNINAQDLSFNLVNHCWSSEVLVSSSEMLQIKLATKELSIEAVKEIKTIFTNYFGLVEHAIVFKKAVEGCILLQLELQDLILTYINKQLITKELIIQFKDKNIVRINIGERKIEIAEQGTSWSDTSDVARGNKINPKHLEYTLDKLIDLTKERIKIIEEDVLDKDKDKDIIDGVQLLIMVVNSNEYYAAMHYFSESKAGIISVDGKQYFIGKWGKIPASLIQQNHNGSFGHGRSEHLTRSSIKLFRNLKFIVALGVCGTVGNLGDVVVSTKICGCNDLKFSGNDDIINRGDIIEAGGDILSILMINAGLWSFVCTKPECKQHKSKAVFKPMLSGTPLIASGDYRDKLIRAVRIEAKGVEMEGIGVLEAIKEAKKRDEIEFVIVKAGCDYADESKNKEWQPVAAMAASDFLYKQVDKKFVYKQFLTGEMPQDDSCVDSSNNVTPAEL